MPDDLSATDLGAACALLRLIRDHRPTAAEVRGWRGGAGAALHDALTAAGVVAPGPGGRVEVAAAHTAGGLVAVGRWVVQIDTGRHWAAAGPGPAPDAEPGAAADGGA